MGKPNPPRDEAYWATHDMDEWGWGRPMPYKTTGAPVASGTKNQVRKISTGRKARGMSSDSKLVR